MKVDKSWRKELFDNCKFLYCQKDESMQDTCMCWGFECGDGWQEPLIKLSSRLEALNLQYWPKYKLRIQTDQVKEKFGTLHFYWSIHHDGNIMRRMIKRILKKLDKSLSKLNYKLMTVIDKAEYVEHKTTELDKSKYLENMRIWKNCTNVKFENKDGKYLMHEDITHCKKSHFVPTKHKVLYKLHKAIRSQANSFGYSKKDLTSVQKVILKEMEAATMQYVNDATVECNNVCEDCGTNIGSDYSPRCETTGWITYLCKQCADDKHIEYHMNGEAWKDGKRISTKAEVKEKNKKHKAALKKKIAKESKEQKLSAEV